MKWQNLNQQECSVARSLSVLGDRWTLLILRECFLRVTRFDKFKDRLGLSRTVLADRLSMLTNEGVIKKVTYQHKPTRYEYKLTDKGLDLYPMLMALVNWGNKHYAGDSGVPLLHRHKKCGKHFTPVSVCSECGEEYHPQEVIIEKGPGYSNEWAGNLNFSDDPSINQD